MKFKKIPAIACSILSLCSCGNVENALSSHEMFVGLSSFDIRENAIMPGDRLGLLYLSSYQNANKDKKHLIQIVALNLETRDTFNILTFKADHIDHSDGDRVYRFATMPEADRERIAHSELLMKQFLTKTMQREVAAFNPADSMIMVLMDKRFEHIGKNDLPTVLGNVQ